MDNFTLKRLEKEAGITLGTGEKERFLKSVKLNLKVLEGAGEVNTANASVYGQSFDNYSTLRNDVPSVSGFASKNDKLKG